MLPLAAWLFLYVKSKRMVSCPTLIRCAKFGKAKFVKEGANKFLI